MAFTEQENNDTIALCMIVKNESKNIIRTIESVISLVDELVVVETGSSDESLDLTKKYGAKVFKYDWDNNFSAARNLALENVKSDWILFLDADEEMDSNTKANLHDAINFDQGVENFLYIVDNFGGIKCQNVQPRLFRNHKNIRYTKPIAENIYDSLNELITNQNRLVRVYPININHFSSEDNDEVMQKFTRNSELLNEALLSEKSSDQEKIHYLMMLINYFHKLNSSHEYVINLINQAFDLMNKNPDLQSKRMIYETDYIHINLYVIDFLLKLKKLDSAKQIAVEAINIYPNSLNLLLYLFSIETAQGNKEQADTIIRHCKKLIDDNSYYKYEQLMFDYIKNNIENLNKQLTN